MKEKTGTVFSIAEDNQPVVGCTISKAVYDNGTDYISYFSLAQNTDISAEIYSYHIKAGENFKFAAGGKHWVKAKSRFKMALLMILN